jgi:hypothetical protein
MKTKKPIEVIYLGERIDLMYNNPRQKFRDKKGQEYYFSKIRGLFFGECVHMNPEGSMLCRPPVLEHQPIHPTKEDALEYEAAKVAVKFYRERKKKAFEFKKPAADITRAIQLLKPYARSLDDITLGRFMGYIKNQLTKKTKGKKKK